MTYVKWKPFFLCRSYCESSIEKSPLIDRVECKPSLMSKVHLMYSVRVTLTNIAHTEEISYIIKENENQRTSGSCLCVGTCMYTASLQAHSCSNLFLWVESWAKSASKWMRRSECLNPTVLSAMAIQFNTFQWVS